MWSPNELLKTEKQRDILSYITLQFFPFKKVPLEHYPNATGPFCATLLLGVGIWREYTLSTDAFASWGVSLTRAP